MLRKILLAVYIISHYSYYAMTDTFNSTVYSGPPSGLPIRKIYVHNRPVYVRQMFVSPQRRQINLGSSEFKTIRIKRFGVPVIPPIVPPAAPPAAPSSAAAAASYSAYSAPSQYSSLGSNTAVSSFSNSFAAPSQAVFAPPAPVFAVAAPVPQFIPPPQPIAPQPVAPLQPVVPEPIEPEVIYPLPQCYTDRSNFMCCNRTLENLMHDSFAELQANRPGWSSCNIHQLASLVQKKAEKLYNTTFEVITGVGDYASKSHFYSDLICKIENDGKFVLAYATPRADAEDGNYMEGDGSAYTESPPSPSYNSGNSENAKLDGDDGSQYQQSTLTSGNSENTVGYGGDQPHTQQNQPNKPPYHKNYMWRS